MKTTLLATLAAATLALGTAGAMAQTYHNGEVDRPLVPASRTYLSGHGQYLSGERQVQVNSDATDNAEQRAITMENAESGRGGFGLGLFGR